MIGALILTTEQGKLLAFLANGLHIIDVKTAEQQFLINLNQMQSRQDLMLANVTAKVDSG